MVNPTVVQRLLGINQMLLSPSANCRFSHISSHKSAAIANIINRILCKRTAKYMLTSRLI